MSEATQDAPKSKLLDDTRQEVTPTFGGWSCLVAKADSVNGNNRLYSKKVLEEVVAYFNANFKEQRCLVGQMGMPDRDWTDLSQTSHVVTDLKLANGALVAEIEILNTPCGKVLGTMLNDKVGLAFRLSGVGNGKVNEEAVLVINEGYRITGVHALPIKEAVKL